MAAVAISCKQETECFPVGSVAALAYILPHVIKECRNPDLKLCKDFTSYLSGSRHLLLLAQPYISFSPQNTLCEWQIIFNECQIFLFSKPAFELLYLIHPQYEAFPCFRWRGVRFGREVVSNGPMDNRSLVLMFTEGLVLCFSLSNHRSAHDSFCFLLSFQIHKYVLYVKKHVVWDVNGTMTLPVWPRSTFLWLSMSEKFSDDHTKRLMFMFLFHKHTCLRSSWVGWGWRDVTAAHLETV